MRKIAKGIDGIRKILAENKEGWQVFLYNEEIGDYRNVAYVNMTVDELRTNYSDLTLTFFQGNGIYFQ